MREDREHIDDLFKESLEQRTFEIPDAFMADINARLDATVQTKKKKRFLFILLLALIAIGTALAVFMFHSQNQVSHSTQTKYATNNHTDTQQTETGNTTNLSTHTPGKHQVTTTKNQSAAKKELINISDKENRTKQAGKANSTTRIIQNTTQETRQNSPLKTNSAKKTTIRKKQNNSKKKSVNATKKATSKMKTSHPGKSSVPNSGDPDPVEKPGEIAKNTEKSKADPKENNHPTAGSDSTNVADSIPSDTLAKSPENNVNPATDIQEDNAKKWRYEIQAYGGIGGNMIHDSKTNQPYSSLLSDQQKSILLPSFGINGNVSYNKLVIGLGLSYSSTGEKYKLETVSHSLKDSTYTEIITDTVWVFDSITGWTPELHDSTIYHTMQVPDSAVQQNTFKNYYSWLSIPISFGHRFEFGDYELIPRIGAQFNIGIGKNNGRYPTENFQDMVAYPAVRFNMSYLIQLEARRNFNQWHIFVNPYFKSMLSPAISGELIRRKYSSWGIQFGVGLKL